jgi:SAM-dependent methyltransferase
LIVDLGTGPGGVAARLARRRPGVAVLGVDRDAEMVATARRRHAGPPNLRFRTGDARWSVEEGATTIVLSSVLHEVFVEAGTDSVGRVLRSAHAALKPGGRLLVRDFVLPANHRRRVLLEHASFDQRSSRAFSDFAGESHHEIRLDQTWQLPGWSVYATDVTSAHEFLHRKDHGDTWQGELAQRYGFWTPDEARSSITSAGFRILRASLVASEWLLSERLRGRLRIRDLHTGAPLELPARKLLIVAEKTATR